MSPASSALQPYEIHANDGLTLDALSDQDILRRLRDDGFVICRGFETSEPAFVDFMGRFTTRFVHDFRPERPAHDDMQHVHHVDVGFEELEVHFEFGTVGEQPDLVSLLCLNPVSEGGETLVCDGVEVWKALEERAREALMNRNVKYTITCPQAYWMNIAGVSPDTDPKEALIPFKKKVPEYPGTVYEFVSVSQDETMLAVTTTKPIVIERPSASGRWLLGACLLENHLGLDVAFEDGSPLPDWLVEAFEGACEKCTLPISWRSGDFVIIDNHRCMHGRNDFDDSSRKVVGLMSAFDLYPS